MNETPNSEFAFARNRLDDAERAPLRPVLWSELTARLAAMRDFRRSLAGVSVPRSPNFSSLAESSQRSCSALADPGGDGGGGGDKPSRVNEKERGVNREALADGKAPQRKNWADSTGTKPGDREQK